MSEAGQELQDGFDLRKAEEAFLRSAAEKGWSVVPCGSDKRCLISWKEFQEKAPSIEQLLKWRDTLNPSFWSLVTGKISRCIVLDFDGAEGVSWCEKWGLKPYMTSPSGGKHVCIEHPGWHVKTLNSKTCADLKKKYPGVDIRADGGYVVVLSNVLEKKYTRCRSLTPDPISCLPGDVADFFGLLAEKKEPVEPPVERKETTVPDGLRVKAETIVAVYVKKAEGGAGRNNAGAELAAQLRDNGYDKNESIEIGLRLYVPEVQSIPDGHGKVTKYDPSEWKATVDSIWSRPPREPWEVQDNDEPVVDEEELKRLREKYRLVPSVEFIRNANYPEKMGGKDAPLLQRAKHLLYGPSASGKSFWAIEQGFRAAKAGFQVLYIAAESSDWCAKQMRGYLDGKFASGGDTKSFTFEDGSKLDEAVLNNFRVFPRTIPMTDPENEEFKRFLRYGFVEDYRPDLVIVDTVSRVVGSGSSTNEDSVARGIHATGEFFVQTYKCAILLIHHTRKTNDSYAGSHVWYSDSDVAYECSHCGYKDTAMLTVSCTKMKGFACPEPLSYKFQGVTFPGKEGEIQESAILERMSSEAAQQRKAENTEVELQRIIIDLTNKFGDKVFSRRDIEEFRGVKESRARDILRELKDGGYISPVREGCHAYTLTGKTPTSLSSSSDNAWDLPSMQVEQYEEHTKLEDALRQTQEGNKQ